MKKLLMLLSFSLLLFSCDKDEQLDGLPEICNQDESRLVELKGSTVSLTDAKQAAVSFLSKNVNHTKSQLKTTKEIEDIHPVVNENQDTTMYIINFVNNEGFVIVSSTRNYMPILAYSDHGSFSLNDMPSGVNGWLADHKHVIGNQLKSPVDSTFKFRRQWFDLEYNEEIPKTLKTKSVGDSEFDRVLEESILQWRTEGYQILPIDQNPGIPDDVYAEFVQIAKDGAASTNHDYRQCSMILLKKEDQVDNIGPFITTKWGQDEPYNRTLSLVDGKYPQAGCVAIAMAQMMKYHNWPSQFEWSQMNNVETLSTNYYATANLIKEVGRAIGTDYGVEESGAYTEDVATVLKNKYGYSNSVKYVESEPSDEYNELVVKRRPIIMSGKREKILFWYKNGHAWICDGYRNTFTSCRYILKVIPFPYEDAAVYDDDILGFLNKHYNWGWAGSYNGWYAAPEIYTKDEYLYYQYDRHNIINIIPNK